MKYVTFILFSLIIISCTQTKEIDYAILSGKITNVDSKTIAIKNNLNKLVKEIKVDDKGMFLDTIYNVLGYYHLDNGNEITTIYLENGYDLSITLDTEAFDETIKFTGKGKDENNYLAKKYLLNEKMENPKVLYALAEADILKKYEELTKKIDNELSKVTNSTFLNLEKENRKYEYVSKLDNYERAHQYITKDMNFKVSESFPDMMQDTIFDNESKYKNFIAYQQLTLKSFFRKAKKNAKKENVSFQKEAIKEVKKVKSPLIKNQLLSFLSYRIGINNDDSKELYDAIMALSTDEKLKKELTKKFKALSKLQKGNISPKFYNYENYKGGTNSLDDFKGKYVYIDVWATWCAPCREEIPSLKRLEEQYKNKDIVFISISIDKQKAHDTWKKMIADLKMTGVQLFADNDWKSSFVQGYGIDGIPRFILIDKQGKIILANAPRPSESKLIVLLDKLNL